MLSDIRHAWRLLRRSPGFTLGGVSTLALGLGATTAIFTLVEAILLRPLPIPQPDRVVTVHLQQGERLSRTFTLDGRTRSASAWRSVPGRGTSSR